MANVFGVSSDLLKQYIEKIERLEKEKSDVLQVIKETYADIKSQGFDTKVIKQVIKERKMDANELAEAETLLLMYKRALGMLPDEE